MYRRHAVRRFCLVAVILIIGAVSQSIVFGREMAPLRYPVGEKAPDAFIPYMASQPLESRKRGQAHILGVMDSLGRPGRDVRQDVAATHSPWSWRP